MFQGNNVIKCSKEATRFMGKAKKTTNIYMAILTASLPEKLKTF